MSNIDNFCNQLDKFGKGLHDLLFEAQDTVMQEMVKAVDDFSPTYPEARYSTGEYKASNTVTESGVSLMLSPNTDHDLPVEEGAEGGWWPMTPGYRVYTRASIYLKRFQSVDIFKLIKNKDML